MEENETIEAALQFVQHAHKEDADFSGTVQFDVSDLKTGESATRYIQVKSGTGVYVHDSLSDWPIDCVIKVEKTVLMAMLTGELDPTVVYMYGQIAVDNVPVMTKFVEAFSFNKDKFEEFKKTLPKTTVEVPPEEQKEQVDPNEVTVAIKDENSNPTDSPKTKDLKQNLAAGGLKFLMVARSIAKDVDSFIDKVKDTEDVKKAVSQLNEETTKFQSTDVFQKIQAHSAFQTIKEGFEKTSAEVSTLTMKAKDKSLGVVETLAKTAYPSNYTPTQIDLSVPIPNNPPPLFSPPSSPSPSPSPSTFLSSPSPALSPSIPSNGIASPSPSSSSPSSSTSSPKPSMFRSFLSAVTISSPPPKRNDPEEERKEKEEREVRQREGKKEKEEREAKQREEKRKQLQAKLEHLQKFNDEANKEKQRQIERMKEEQRVKEEKLREDQRAKEEQKAKEQKAKEEEKVKEEEQKEIATEKVEGEQKKEENEEEKVQEKAEEEKEKVQEKVEEKETEEKGEGEQQTQES